MALNDPVPGGEEAAKSPMERNKSILGADSIGRTKRLLVDSNGNLQVTAFANNAGVLASGSETNVPSTTLTTIVTYSATTTIQISRISCSGSVYAVFGLYLNTTLIEVQRSGPNRNIQFGALSVVNTDILEVKITHPYTSQQEDFEATLYGG